MIRDNPFLLIGGVALIFMALLLTSGCMTAGEYVDGGLSAVGGALGSAVNWTTGVLR